MNCSTLKTWLLKDISIQGKYSQKSEENNFALWIIK